MSSSQTFENTNVEMPKQQHYACLQRSLCTQQQSIYARCGQHHVQHLNERRPEKFSPKRTRLSCSLWHVFRVRSTEQLYLRHELRHPLLHGQLFPGLFHLPRPAKGNVMALNACWPLHMICAGTKLCPCTERPQRNQMFTSTTDASSELAN